MTERDTYQMAGGTAAEWAAVNPTLLLNQDGIESDTLKRKTGDGSTPWSGLGYSAGPTQTGGSSIWSASVATIAALKALNAGSLSVGDRVWVDGYHAGSTQGGGAFVVIDDASEADDGGHIIAPNSAAGNKKYARMGVNRMTANVVNFGAKGDLSTNDAPAIQAAVDSVEAACYNASGSDTSRYIWGGEIYFPGLKPGYRINSTIDIPSTIFGLQLHGPASIRNFTTSGTNSRIFRVHAAVDGGGFPANNHRGLHISDFCFDWEGGSSDSNAAAIYFDNDIGSGHLVEVGIISNCYCREGYNFVKQHTSGSSYVSQLTISDCFTQSMSSSAIYMNQGLIGNTSLNISDLRTGSSTSDPTIHLDGFHSFHIQNCSFEASPGSTYAPTFRFENCQGACSFSNNRTEWGGANNRSIITMTGGASAISVVDFEIRHHTVSSGNDTTIFNVDGGKLFVRGLLSLEQGEYAGSNDLNIFDVASGATAVWDGWWFRQNGTGTPNETLKIGAGTFIDRTV